MLKGTFQRVEQNGEYAFLQPCHSAVLNMHAFLQPIRICLNSFPLIQGKNKINFSTKNNHFLKFNEFQKR